MNLEPLLRGSERLPIQSAELLKRLLPFAEHPRLLHCLIDFFLDIKYLEEYFLLFAFAHTAHGFQDLSSPNQGLSHGHCRKSTDS